MDFSATVRAPLRMFCAGGWGILAAAVTATRGAAACACNVLEAAVFSALDRPRVQALDLHPHATDVNSVGCVWSRESGKDRRAFSGGPEDGDQCHDLFRRSGEANVPECSPALREFCASRACTSTL